MRNLLLTQRVHLSVSSTEIPDLPLTATAWDAATDSLICTFGPSGVESVIEVKRLQKQGQISTITSFDVPCELPSLKCDLVLSLHFFADTNTICIVFAGGNIVVVEVDENFASRGVEIVGSVDEGITGASWSPDEEVLAITTSASTFLLMTRSFENIATTTFTETDLLASNHVSVGWGKKETQFQGKRAKAMRDPTVPEYVDEGILSASDDGKVTISWRGDGAYLAISGVQNVEDKRRRIIRVYSREGTLDSVSEPVDRLEGTLSWRPSGNLIAGIQMFPDTSRIDVVFFERNGLRHGEFTMSIPGGSFEGQNIYELAWNADSTVLAVVLKGRVQLWTMGNYHYYLKQEIIYDAEGSLNYPEDAPVVVWHPEKALQLALNLNDKVVVYSWIWSVHRGTTQPPNDHGMVAVIDGGKLKLTPLRWANVPPPIALYDIQLETTPIDVAVSYTDGLIAVLRSTGLDLVKWYPGKPRDAKKPKLIANATRFQALDSVRQIAFLSSNRLTVLVDAIACCMLLHYDIDFSSSTITKAGEEILPLGTTRIVPDALDATGEFYYVENHRIVTSANDPNTKLEFPTTCPWVEMARIDGQVNYFGLSENGKLYANSTLIAPNCTSFIVTNAHLIYTTTQHFVKFVHLQTGGKDFEIPTDDPTGDERCRSIERGAKLVHVMPSSFSLTLQMPRGNLETIYPRALVVAGIRRSIEAKDYKTAFLACRSQRVDLNILHDHAPEQFLQNVELFIDQVKKVEHVDLFLSQLREEDVSQTMYRETLPRADVPSTAKKSQPAQTDSKVNKICNAFLDVLLPSRLSTKLQNIVTAYVCKSPPDHDAALLLIAKLREGNTELVEKAVEHVCWLADANNLYNNALGLYNLELTLLVAQQSQKDPREYLPFLQSLEELEHNRRRFVIDDHLGRHVKALRSLVDMGDDTFEEAKTYIVKHALYQQALGLYKYNEDKQKKLMLLYAEYLDEQSRFREAGLAYESIQHLHPALLAYRRANLWQQALSLALLIPISNSELSSLSESLADHLIEAKDFSSAAQIYVDYRNDIPEATRLLCRGSHFAEAMRLVANSGKPELLQSVVDAGLVEAFSTTVELLADCKAQAHAQLGRLRELRAKKEEDPLAYFEGLPEGSGANIPDNISLAPTDASTSGGTFMTRYTGKTAGTAMTGATRRTSKNRKREERKRARGKKGTIYEEEYLVRSLARLVERLEIVKDEIGRLVEGMVRRGMRERATAVQEKMVEMGGILKGCVEEVFSDKNAVNLFFYGTGGGDGEGDDGEGGHGPVNVNGEKKIPVVKDFERLAIL
ncbi:IkappaB kinase complex, IKAP component [Terfezia boudieri ATCC MYA-4762]|uniref:Elongator complex protein 1 n=1 Tax=Terfezia boudieri ATCC MYA-4762 TaxID=1051890 RepID=A0A3N4M3T3_9PEZI|nr:IkappaB kinase complex, IKAP component [Terfezia boudieri ATCC MYA-4762]